MSANKSHAMVGGAAPYVIILLAACLGLLFWNWENISPALKSAPSFNFDLSKMDFTTQMMIIVVFFVAVLVVYTAISLSKRGRVARD
jgi:hypothetical protein